MVDYFANQPSPLVAVLLNRTTQGASAAFALADYGVGFQPDRV